MHFLHFLQRLACRPALLPASQALACRRPTSSPQRKADELGEGVFQALRRHRGGTLNAELERWAAQLEDVLTQLDALPLGEPC